MRGHLADILSANMDYSAVEVDGSRYGFDQRGFSGAVFTQQGMHFAFKKTHRNIVQG